VLAQWPRVSGFAAFFFGVMNEKEKRKREIKGKSNKKNLSEKRFRSD